DFQGARLAEAVRNGRRAEFAKFPEFADPAARNRIPAPAAEETFVMSKLAWAELDEPAHAEWLGFYQALIALRRREIAPRLKGISGTAGRFRIVGPKALEVVWQLGDGARLTLTANYDTAPSPRPTTPPPEGQALFATSATAADRAAADLPPHSVVFYLETPGDG